MGGIGIPELLLVLAIVIIVFGATRLPQLGDALGRGIRNFKKAATGEDEIDVTPTSERLEESKEQPDSTRRFEADYNDSRHTTDRQIDG